MGRTRALCMSALFVIFYLFYPVNAMDAINQTQFISDANNQSLVSPDGSFKLGFFSPAKSRFRYIGIWFNTISIQTVVWVANRERPIKNFTGVLKIDENGNLAIFDGIDSSSLWSTNVSVVTRTSKARLLDSGNLVLVAENERDKTETIIWQSFDYPTNTMLPGMKFGMNKKTGLIHTISSWKSSDDPSPGNFFARVNPQGSPQFFLHKNSALFWRTGPWNGRNLNGIPDVTIPLRGREIEFFSQIDLNNYKFVNNENEVYAVILSRKGSPFSISVLDPTGTFQKLVWHDQRKTWQKFWITPHDLCDEYARCGANAMCDEDMLVRCTCLPGFDPLNPNDWNLECVEKRKVDGCGKGDGEGFVRLEGVKIPDARTSKLYSNMSLKECERECLKNCSCTGYATADVYEDGRGCMTWYDKLMDMRLYKDGQDFYLRVDAVELAANARKKSKQFLDNRTLSFIVLLFVAEVPLLAACFYYLWRRHQSKGKKRNQRLRSMLLLDSATSSPSYRSSPRANNSVESSNIELSFFNFSTVRAATENFSSAKKLGQGGFGPVFKGQLPNGQEIAVKRLSQKSGQGIVELKNEILLIAKLQHRNLVRLLGCCIEEDEKMLIYEFMPNKSLDYFIFDESRKLFLNWEKRFDIILGIARGILYLHQDSRLTIIHRDLKASNILLDGEMKPKISDFGTARIFGGDQTQAKTNRVFGTFGYMSPEYILRGIFSKKSDVFSFGVLILEIVSGKKNSEFHPDDPLSNLIKYTWELWRDGNVLQIVDSSIADSCPVQEIFRCIQVGLLCVQDDAGERPTMSTAIFMLSNETPLPSPKQPTSYIKRYPNEQGLSITRTRFSNNEETMTTFSAR